MPEDKTVFEKRPEARDFLGVSSRFVNGDMIFPKLQEPVEFEVTGWEMFTPQQGNEQKALILRAEDNREFLRPLGSTMEWKLANLGYEGPDDVVKSYIQFETYETGSAGKFAIGLRIVAVLDRPVLAEFADIEED